MSSNLKEIFDNLILESKLTLPILKERVIYRPRIMSLLNKKRHCKLILIVTAAGYGKTTLLTQYLRQLNLPAVYYCLDRKDSGLLKFISYLIRGLERIDPGLVTEVKNLFSGSGQIVQHYELFMGSLINEIVNKIDKDLYIILDDYHNLAEDSLVHKALNYFIDYIPNKIHVIIASRIIPPLVNLAQWRAKQDLYEIYRDGLRFTPEEIKELFDAYYGKDLTSDAIKMVYDKTDGWITGIQLILYSALNDRGIIEKSINEYEPTRQPIFDYFARVIFESEPRSIQDFLKRSSIMDIISAESCNHILKIRNAGAFLHNIERRNIFLNAIGRGKYKYHPLFREFLKRLLQEEKDYRQLHRRAADYYFNENEWELAVEHYLAAEDYCLAARLIFNQADNMFNQARHDLLNDWMDSIPDEFYLQQPRLFILRARLMQEKGFPTKANELLNRVERQLLREGFIKKRNRALWIELLCERADFFIREGYFQEALGYLKKALRICPSFTLNQRGEILNLKGIVWSNLGDLKKAKGYFIQAKTIMEKLRVHCSILDVECNLTSLLAKQGKLKILYEMYKPLLVKLRSDYCWRDGGIIVDAAFNALELGREKEAEDYLNEGLKLCQLHHDPKTLAGIYLGFGALYLFIEKWDSARHYLDTAVKSYQQLGYAPTLLDLCFLRFYRFQQDYDQGRKILTSVLKKCQQITTPLQAALKIEWALYEMACGNLAEARVVIRQVLSITRSKAWEKEEFLTWLAEAELNMREHRPSYALSAMKRAIKLTKTNGYHGLLKCELRSRNKLAHLLSTIMSDDDNLLPWQITPKYPIIIINFFGGFRITDEKGQPINIAWPSEKTRSLFCYLVINRSNPIDREMLLERIWPDIDLTRANVNFRTTACRLRTALNQTFKDLVKKHEILKYQHKKYYFMSGIKMKVDMEEFDMHLREANLVNIPEIKKKHIKAALELYRGDFLPDMYDRWTDLYRQRLRSDYLNCLLWLARDLTSSGDYEYCLEICEKYLRHERCSEEINRIYMKALFCLGRLNEVKNQFERLKREFHLNFHTRPSKEIRDFYKSLMKSQTSC